MMSELFPWKPKSSHGNGLPISLWGNTFQYPYLNSVYVTNVPSLWIFLLDPSGLQTSTSS